MTGCSAAEITTRLLSLDLDEYAPLADNKTISLHNNSLKNPGLPDIRNEIHVHGITNTSQPATGTFIF